MKTVSSTICYKYNTIYIANIYLIFNSNLFRLSDNTKGTEKFIADICEQLASVLTFKVYTKEDLAVKSAGREMPRSKETLYNPEQTF